MSHERGKKKSARAAQLEALAKVLSGLGAFLTGLALLIQSLK